MIRLTHSFDQQRIPNPDGMLLRPAAGGLGVTGLDPGGTEAPAASYTNNAGPQDVIVEAAAEAGRFLLRRVLAPGGALGGTYYVCTCDCER